MAVLLPRERHFWLDGRDVRQPSNPHHADQSARVCGRRRPSAMELQRPKFGRRAQGRGRARARTQASVAVSANGRDWVLLNASPDLRQQINETPELQPAADKGPRNSPIKAVVLTNGDVDAIAGLLTLREAQAFTVYGSSRVLDVLASNSIFDVLDASIVARKPMALGRAFRGRRPGRPGRHRGRALSGTRQSGALSRGRGQGGRGLRHAGRRHPWPESDGERNGPALLLCAELRQA